MEDPGLWHPPARLERTFPFCALPAFFIGLFITTVLGKYGMNQILGFMISMPLLIFGWFYFVGWVIDRWSFKRSDYPTPFPFARKSSRTISTFPRFPQRKMFGM
jgi:hypothetical protein